MGECRNAAIARTNRPRRQPATISANYATAAQWVTALTMQMTEPQQPRLKGAPAYAVSSKALTLTVRSC